MIPDLPDYNSDIFANDIIWDTTSTDRPEHYLKMYCELMAGGDSTRSKQIGKLFDEDIAKLCRKAMFDYASEQMEVTNLNTNKYQMKSYKLPLRVFDDSVIEWCKTNKSSSKVSDSLPNQMGSCDVLLGRACQQLQADGWIDPRNFVKSEILSTFTTNSKCNGLTKDKCTDTCKWNADTGTCDGTLSDGTNKHTLTSDKLKNVCSCFLLGTECVNGNCSYTYCGAGSDCEKNKDKASCEAEYCTWDSNICKNPLNMQTTVNNKELPKWYTTFDKDNLTCGYTNNGSVGQHCYTGCNYVNSYDVCWNAGPDDRKGPIYQKQLTQWDCTNNNCESVAGKYSCLGTCSTDQEGYPNCGTESWFSQNICNTLTNEQDCNAKVQCTWDNTSGCKTIIKPSVPNMLPGNQLSNVNEWSSWQNYYVQNIAGQKPASGDIPGIGFVMFVKDSDKIKYCNSGLCDITNPERIVPNSAIGKLDNCSDTTCTVNQNIIADNSGKIGGSLIMSNKTYQECKFTYNSPLNATDPDVKNKYINFMGNINNCSGTTCDPSKICIDVASGDNCSDCSTLGAKSNMCCISQDIFDASAGTKVCYPQNSLNKSDKELCGSKKTEIDCTSTNELASKCKWGSEDFMSNNEIVNIVGSKVSYLCQESCPKGSMDVRTLANSCTKGCGNYTTETECKTCKYCSWDINSKKCNYACPAQNTSVVSTKVEQNPVTPEPTQSPTQAPKPTQAPEESFKNYLIIAGSVIGGIAVIVGVIWGIYIKKRKK
jgi:hypothetical protein